MPLSPAVRVRYDNTVQAAVPNTALFQFYPCLRCHLTVTPLAYKRRPMRNVEGGGHSRSVSLAARVYCSTQRPRARTQYKPQSSSRVLRIRAARSWVNPSCASSRSALRATSAPRRTRKGLGPHRCSWRQISPDIFGAPGRRRRGCVNLIRRPHRLYLHHLHRHATEEEGSGGGWSVRVEPTAPGANGRRGRHRRRNGRRRASSWRRGVRTCTAPLSGGAGPAASWHSRYHTLAGPRSSWRVSGCSRRAYTPTCWRERGTVAWTGCCSF